MFSPIFDGQFRSKPSVSLRGASKQGELSSSLLHKAHNQREEREKERVRNHSATVIQATFRGHVTRQNVYKELREQYDIGCVQCTNHTQLVSLTRKFLLFYSESKDHPRLLILCQKWIQFKSSMVKAVTTPNSHALNILCRLVTVCLKSLYYNPHQSLAGPLRMIEVFTNEIELHEFTPVIFNYLLKKGYFSTLRHMLETRLPSPDEDSSNLLPLASSLLEYIYRPIKSCEKESYIFVITELLAPPLSSHLCYLVVPSLDELHLPLSSILELITSNIIRGHLEPSSTLCYCIMRLAQSHMSSLSDAEMCQLLLIINRVIESGVSLGRSSDELEDEEKQDEEDETMELDPTSGPFALFSCIMEQVTNGPIVDTFLKYQNPSGRFINSLCSTCYYVIASSSFSSPFRYRLLRYLALSSPLLQQIWKSLSSLCVQRSFGPSVNALDHIRRGSSLPPHEGKLFLHLLSAFSSLLSISLSSLHDIELSTHSPFSLKVLSEMVLKLRDVFVTLHMNTYMSSNHHIAISSHGPSTQEWQLLNNLLYRLLRSLYDRNSRLDFCSCELWASLSLEKIPPELYQEEEDEDVPRPPYPAVVLKQAALLNKTPFVFSFMDRVTFFHKLVMSSRTSQQGRLQEFLIGHAIDITVRRTHLYEDAFAKLATADIRQRLRVNLINAQGLDEAGIDGGGLFREFLSETLKTAFDPNRGFFTSSEEGFLYPNPKVHLINEDYKIHFKFLGALLGKALFERMMVELPFASFFLRKLTSSGRGWVDTHHLASLDPELYRHLLWLKNYNGNFEDLGLDFTTLSNEYGQSRVIELKPGGGHIPVTWTNRIEYIHLLADYHLNRQLETQFQAFREGLNGVVPLSWLTLFNQTELQTLISGAEVPIDIQDLRSHTRYSGEYKDDHSCIKMFWNVVNSFSENEKRQLLKFVTSCSRPPMLGFKELHPPFTILSARESNHLPSASTCMHLLKLPMFETIELMKEKLLYAISSGAGFELS